MASLLEIPAKGIFDVLDPGAGAGALTECIGELLTDSQRITLVESDPVFSHHLHELIDDDSNNLSDESEVITDDFIKVGQEWKKNSKRFKYIITNPPYAKIAKYDEIKPLLSANGIKATNIFAAFIWMCSDLLEDDGRLVAVVPRSILSGSHYAPLRDHIFQSCSIFRLHHYVDRRKVFSRDSVQQEVVVIGIVKNRSEKIVKFSRSISTLESSEIVSVPRERMIMGPEEHHVVLVPSINEGEVVQLPAGNPLIPREFKVSVGSIVDFRFDEWITEQSNSTVPLIGSEQFYVKQTKCRNLQVNHKTENHIYAPGVYVIVRRISPAEGNSRMRVKVINATGPEYKCGVAFENHVIVVHDNKRGLGLEKSTNLATCLLDPTADQQFRERGGTTQVNISDLLALKIY